MAILPPIKKPFNPNDPSSASSNSSGFMNTPQAGGNSSGFIPPQQPQPVQPMQPQQGPNLPPTPVFPGVGAPPASPNQNRINLLKNMAASRGQKPGFQIPGMTNAPGANTGAAGQNAYDQNTNSGGTATGAATGTTGAATGTTATTGTTTPAATPPTDPNDHTGQITAFYNNLMGQQASDWQSQQGMLKGQMAGFQRQADSLNARMGGSIAGGYAGLAGSGLNQGMNEFNKAALNYNQLRQQTGRDEFGALSNEQNTLRGRQWAVEDQASAVKEKAAEAGAAGIPQAAKDWYSGADGGTGLDWSRASSDADKKAAQDAYADWQQTGNPDSEKKFTDLLHMSTYNDRNSGGQANRQQQGQDMYDQIMNNGSWSDKTKRDKWNQWKKDNNFS